MKKRSALAALAAALVACTPAEPPHDARRADQKGELALATGSADQPGAPSACKPPAREALGADRAAATRSFVAGAHREAIAELGALVRRRPNDLASLALLLAARQRQEAAATRASDELTRLASVRLRAPSGAQQTNRKLDIPPRELKLQRVAERKNLITDDEVFHQKHGVTRAELAEHRAGVEDLPDAAPRALGNARAFRVFSHADHDIVSYGTALLYMPRVGPTRIYDITNLHQVQDAQMVGDALIVASWRNGYAKDVQNQTAYLTAHDQATGELLWQSDPLVSSGPFLVTGSHIISGYGFTAEPDFVFLIDLATGKTVQREALQSGPSMIVLRGDRVHLRNYDTDAEFKLSPAPTAAPAVAAPKEPPTAAPDAAIVCEVERAIVAIDARDVGQLLQTIGALRSAQERELAASLEGVRGFLEQQAGSQPGIDLWRRPPSVLPPPPWERTLVKPAGAPVTHQPRLSPLAFGVLPKLGPRRERPDVGRQGPHL